MTHTATNPAPGSEADAIPSRSAPLIPTLHRDYFEQILPAPPVICGRRLKPLSLGRYRLMHRHKVAFVADTEAIPQAGDLLLGVLICSLTVAEFQELLEAPDLNRQIHRWGQKAGFYPPACLGWPVIGPLLRRCFGNIIAAADLRLLLGEIQRFHDYILAGSVVPPHWNESQNSRLSAAHWSQNIEVVLRGELGWSKLEVDEEPLTKALWDYFKHMENHGLVRLMDDAERRELETPLTPEELEATDKWLAEMAAAKAAETAAQPTPA